MNTLKWWMDPARDGARPFSFGGTLKPFTLGFELKTFLAKHNPEEYWANDPSFDYVVLRQWWRRQNARAVVGVPHLGDYPLGPDAYRKERSYRTIMAECERLGFDTKDFKGTYIAHDPVEDAASQARAVIAARQVIGGPRR
jgi:hypothetical protein